MYYHLCEKTIYVSAQPKGVRLAKYGFKTTLKAEKVFSILKQGRDEGDVLTVAADSFDYFQGHCPFDQKIAL